MNRFKWTFTQFIAFLIQMLKIINTFVILINLKFLIVMKKYLFTLVILFGLISYGYSQDYKTAIGGKLGYGLIASYKTFLNEKAALDLFGGIRRGGVAAGAYYLNHTPIPSISGLQWYWGFGGSFTTWNYGLLNTNYYELGGSGVLGLDYAFDDIPLNLSLDWAPTIVLLSNAESNWNLGRFRGGYGALTVRYILTR